MSLTRQQRWLNKPENRTQAYERQKAVRDERMALVGEMKRAAGCVDCGYDLHAAALHYDHVRGEKLFDISFGVRTYAWERVLEEIAKCEVRCANCHAVVTAERRLVLL